MWLQPFIKSSTLLTVFRTLFYQFLLITIGLSIGFALNAEYVGWKSSIATESFTKIFNPTEFDQDICNKVKNWGAYKIWAELERPQKFEIIQDGLLNEEFYIGKFKYLNAQNKEETNIISTRVRWKTWEHYYEKPETLDSEALQDYIDNGTLNSQESDKALALYQELKKQNNEEQ